jgi:sulfatase maturation enzyme AslB (radical SAM superfamily)
LQASLDATLRSAIDNLEVTFTGGEPLLAFATLRRAVSYVEERIEPSRVQWRVLTNGLLLNDDILAFLDAHRFLVNLSCDGIPAAQILRGRETHPRLNNLFDHLREKYTELFDKRLTLCLTLSPAAIPWLADSAAYFIEKQIAAFSISPTIGGTEWRTSRIEEIEQQFKKISVSLLRHYDRTGQVPLLLFRKPAGEAVPSLSEWTCSVTNSHSAVIDVDGNVYACLPATRTYQPDPAPVLRRAVEALRLGRAQAPGFEERCAAMIDAARATGAFQHPERRYSSYKRCADCEFATRCRICPLASASVRGWPDMYRVPDFLCAFSQVACAHRDRFPSQPTAYDFLSGKVPLSARARHA